MITDSDVIIIGAGAAGLTAAGFIRNKSVIVLERNEKAGKKLYITGKGRCNITNDCMPEEFLSSVVRNPKFLFSSIYGFTPADTVKLIESHGVPTKTERGKRVFPVSDKSSDVIKALASHAQSHGAWIIYGERVSSAAYSGDKFHVRTNSGEYACKYLLVATGGLSYPSTGSTGDGYTLAQTFGHKIITPKPSLVNLVTKQNVASLAGLTLKNVNVTVTAGGKSHSEFGEMLYTHNGVSGPTVLSLSAYVCKERTPMTLTVDLKPALDDETLDKRILSDFGKYQNKQLKNSLDELLPKALTEPVIKASGLQADKKVNILSREERLTLVRTLKNLTYDIVDFGKFENAVITAGGVDTKEINPRTMESKLIQGLYFAGEVIDVDALTGGFNIQIALSTAHTAATAIEGE